MCCSSSRCTFEATSSLNCLVDHCQKAHNWKEIPCTFDGCYFVAYNTKSLTAHKAGFHSQYRSFIDREFPCTWKDCKSSFCNHRNLEIHRRIHTNGLSNCVFCPYRTNQGCDMKSHYRFHFKMYDLKCDYCDKKFISKKTLNHHYSIEHSEINYSCHICNKYSGPRSLLQDHIKNSHKLSSRWNKALNIFDTFPPH